MYGSSGGRRTLAFESIQTKIRHEEIRKIAVHCAKIRCTNSSIRANEQTDPGNT
jgi:hypothetical protein